MFVFPPPYRFLFNELRPHMLYLEFEEAHNNIGEKRPSTLPKEHQSDCSVEIGTNHHTM
jgi:hypothetical protein